MQTITKQQAKQFILSKQGLIGQYRFIGKDGAYAYVRQAGCIQFDPVDVCGTRNSPSGLLKTGHISRPTEKKAENSAGHLRDSKNSRGRQLNTSNQTVLYRAILFL